MAEINAKPERETDFNIQNYKRQVFQCSACRVFFNVYAHKLDYNTEYASATYGDKVHATFEKIMALPPESSDNRSRVARVAAKASPGGWVLDVGGGTGVFLAAMKALKFKTCFLEPGEAYITHARQIGMDELHHGTLADFRASHKFDVIAFNKVLEHVEDPIEQLKLALPWLAPGGFIYIELPDAEGALKAGSAEDSEEFFIEHHFIFNPSSVRYLVDSAGMKLLEMQQIGEPSGKHTIYAFLEAPK